MMTGTARRLTAAERAREPRSLAVLAWFDGNTRAHNPAARPTDYPRRLDPHEAAAWREGWRLGLDEASCHRLHGFGPHIPECSGWSA